MIAIATKQSSSIDAVGWFLEGQLPPDRRLMRVPIPIGRLQVGRRPDAQVFVADPSISKNHAEFISTERFLIVRDLGSTNGTFVNGKRIQQDVQVYDRDIIQFAGFEFVVGQTCDDQPLQTQVQCVADWMQTLSQFQRLLSDRAVVPHFQPIVRLTDGKAIGYEVLARSVLPGMVSPREMFEAAERTNQAASLSILCRQMGLDVAQRHVGTATIFVNTHPSETVGSGLLESLTELRVLAPHQQIVLELHESAVTRPTEILRLSDELKKLNIGLAYDDFGAGQSRLQELAEVAPDYLKFDMSLIRGIHQSVQRQQIVAGLVRMALDLNIQPLAEGIENVAEAEACREIGFIYGQGYYFGKPAPGSLLKS